MDLRIGRTDSGGSFWTVMADIAMVMFMILVIYIVAQYLRSFERVFVAERLETLQDSVATAVRERLSEEFQPSVVIETRSPDEQRFTFSADVLFAVCRHDIQQRGRELLLQVGEVLLQRASYFEAIQVDGHTDVQQPRSQRRPDLCPYPSNWELSSSRATSVVRLFADEIGIESERLSARGWAQFHPVSEDLRLNRRIEVTLRYDRAAIERELRSDSLAGS